MKIQNQISESMKNSMLEFLDNLTLRKSQATVSFYRYDISKFLEYLASKDVYKLSNIKTSHIESYLSFCKSADKSSLTLSRYYMAIKAYTKYLRKNKLVK